MSLPADFHFWFVLLALVFMTIALVRELASTEMVVFGTLLVLLLGQVLTPKEAFAGFSNGGVLTILFLYVIAGALQATQLSTALARPLFSRGNPSLTWRLARLLTPLTALSAFTNNTTIVAALVPVIRKWARQNSHPASKYLLPLSYATILGGLCTLVGTSTNLILHGFLLEMGHPGFSFFDLSVLGLPVAFIGLLYIIFIAHRLLPANREPFQNLGSSTREFVVEMKVGDDFPGIRQTVEEAGLRHLRGLFLFQIERDGRSIAPVQPLERVYPGDRLFFTGLPETILELQKFRGLRTVEDATFDPATYDSDRHGVFEAVVSGSSPLVGQTVRESAFRDRYDAVILAIHRNGERIEEKVGDIVLHGGDTLLLLAQMNFDRKWYHSRDFYLVTRHREQESNKPPQKAWLTAVLFLGFILAAVTGVLPTVAAAAAAAMGLLLFRCLSPQDAKSSINYQVVITIAAAFGIGKAVANVGLASTFAELLTQSLGDLGVLPVLFGLYFLTNIYSAFITNAAAAALLFPVAVSLAEGMSLPLLPLALLIAVAASAEFSLPIGYQTNLMVYGPGGYRVRDYLRAGLPLNLMAGIVSVWMAYWWFFLG